MASGPLRASWPVTTILILHDDLAFVLWLGQILNKAGYKTVPANSVAQAQALIATFQLNVDLLIANLKIGGAAHFAAGLRRKRARMRVVVVAEPAGSPARMVYPDEASLRPALPRLNWRPQFTSAGEAALAESEWLATLEQVIAKGGQGRRTPHL